MVTVTLPMLLSDVVGEVREASAEGSTIGAVIDSLDAQFPGLKSHILRDGKPIVTITFTVDGRIAAAGLQTPVPPDARVAILPTFGGG